MKYIIALLAVVLVAGCTSMGDIPTPPGAPEITPPVTPEAPEPPETPLDGSQVLTEPNQTEHLPPEGTPMVTITSPEAGEVLKSTTIGARVELTDFRLAGLVTGKENKENEGHIFATLDDKNKTSSVKTFAFSNVPKGEHTLTVELRNNDRTPLDPPVKASVSFTTE